MHIPLIGIPVCPSEDGMDYVLRTSYVDAITAAGGCPVLLPQTDCWDAVASLLPTLDGLLLPGGYDIDPSLFHELPVPQTGIFHMERDQFEFRLIRQMHALHRPILGICRGLQVINVCFGGSLWQDIPSQLGGCHQQTTPRDTFSHNVRLTPGSLLHRIYGSGTVPVNSFHHESIKEPGPALQITAVSEDGIIEGIELGEEILAVQWHPELLMDTGERHDQLLRWFVARAREEAARRNA